MYFIFYDFIVHCMFTVIFRYNVGFCCKNRLWFSWHALHKSPVSPVIERIKKWNVVITSSAIHCNHEGADSTGFGPRCDIGGRWQSLLSDGDESNQELWEVKFLGIKGWKDFIWSTDLPDAEKNAECYAELMELWRNRKNRQQTKVRQCHDSACIFYNLLQIWKMWTCWQKGARQWCRYHTSAAHSEETCRRIKHKDDAKKTAERQEDPKDEQTFVSKVVITSTWQYWEKTNGRLWSYITHHDRGSTKSPDLMSPLTQRSYTELADG